MTVPIFGCSLAQTPINFGSKSCFFGKLLPVPKLCKRSFSTCASMMMGTVSFQQKTNAKFGGVGANGDRGKNLSSKVPYLKSPTLICLFAVPFSWGYDDD